MAGKFEKVREGIQDNICGICIAACFWTQEYIEQPRQMKIASIIMQFLSFNPIVLKPHIS